MLVHAIYHVRSCKEELIKLTTEGIPEAENADNVIRCKIIARIEQHKAIVE